jgi:hypothetical protein
MCKGPFVCHGDFSKFNDRPLDDEFPIDAKAAMFLITSDGKYAINADLLDLENLAEIDFENIPKIRLNLADPAKG